MLFLFQPMSAANVLSNLKAYIPRQFPWKDLKSNTKQDKGCIFANDGEFPCSHLVSSALGAEAFGKASAIA